jgi:hypothetical protein
MTTVLHKNNFFIASVTACSDMLSKELVGSSNINIEGFLRKILAIANLCLSHHDSLIPLSQISVSNQSF